MWKKNLMIFGFIASVLVILSIATGCAQKTAQSASKPETVQTKTEDSRAGWPKELTFGTGSSSDEDSMVKRYTPFAKYLEKKIGIPVKLFVGTDYAASVEAMKSKHLDVASFGQFSYIYAAERANAEPFAMSVKAGGIKTTRTMYITVNDGIKTIDDMKGKKFAWVDPLSATGCLLPKYDLYKRFGVKNVDSLFSTVSFSGGHDASVLAVLNGDADAAAVSESTGGKAIKTFSTHPNAQKLRILGYSEYLTNWPYCYRSDLPESLKKAVKEAFFDAINDPDLKGFLKDNASEDGFVTVSDSNYDLVRETAKLLGLSPEDLLKN